MTRSLPRWSRSTGSSGTAALYQLRVRRQAVVVQTASAGNVGDDRPVGEPLHWCTVVGEDVAAEACGRNPTAEERHERAQRGRDGADPLHEVGTRRRRCEREDQRVETQRVPGPRGSELGTKGRGDRAKQATVAGDAGDVQRDGAALGQMRTDKREELAGRDLKGDVRLAIRVDRDDVVVF